MNTSVVDSNVHQWYGRHMLPDLHWPKQVLYVALFMDVSQTKIMQKKQRYQMQKTLPTKHQVKNMFVYDASQRTLHNKHIRDTK